MKHGKIHETEVAYLSGRIDNQLETAANSMGVAKGELAIRVAEVLLRSTGREVFRPEDRVPNKGLRSNSSKRSSASLEMAVDERSSSSARKGPGSYWASMTKEERAAEMKRRMKKRTKTN